MTIKPEESSKLTTYLREMLESGSSDLHITASSTPKIRLGGKLNPLDHPPLSGQETQDLLYSILPDSKKQRLESERELRFSFDVEGLARFRGSLFFQQQTLAGVFRSVPYQLSSFDDLALPPVVQNMCKSKSGLIVVSGSRSSGKSTTLAAIVDWINTHNSFHIMTIEDPIEYIHKNKKSIISQREVDRDTLSLSRALSSAMTEDMDVILIGELIDGDTTEKAVEAALSGHLVLTSLSSISALETLYKMIEWFPPHRESRAKTRLSSCLQGIIHQTLVQRADGNGMAIAVEILVQTPAVKNLIREDKVHQIYSLMQSQGSTGMVTLNQSLSALVSDGVVARDMALESTISKHELLDILSRS